MEVNEESLEGYDIEQILEELNAKYFVVEKFQSSDYEDGYVGVYLENSEYAKVLEEDGFEKIKDDFYLKELDKINFIPENELKKIKLDNSEKFKAESNAQEFHKRFEELIALWDKIVKKYTEINKLFLRFHQRYYFEPSVEVLEKALNIPLILVSDASSLGRFCYLLYQLTYECVSEPTKEFIGETIKNKSSTISSNKEGLQYFKDVLLGKDKYLNNILLLRNYYEHLRLKKNKNTILSPIEKEVAFIECIKEKMLKKLTNEYEYFHLQIEILNDCFIHLTKLYVVFSTEDIVK